MPKPRKKTNRARAEAAEAANIASVTKAIHAAAAKALRKRSFPAQTLTLKSGAGGGMKMMQGKISPPIEPSCYVAVIVPVYGKISPPIEPS